MNSQVSPAAIAPPAANYAHGVVSTGPMRILHTAGTVPVRPDGTVPAELDAQAETVWANLTAIVHEAGMAPSDVVSVTTYVVAGENLGTVMAARDRALGGHRAASTLIVVPALARPEWRMEIALVAVAEE
jgi:enamine deaminase RidA (YjgF/YER057c/UK114 family)